MADESNNSQENNTNQDIDFKVEYTKLTLERDKLIGKNQELLNEKQKEAEKRRNAESQTEVERVEKLKKDGDYKSIVESSQRAQKEWEQRFNDLNTKIAQKEVRQAAMKLANALDPLDGDAAEMMADYLEKRIKYNENGFNILDANGNVSVMGFDQLQEEFKNSNRFKPLMRGSRANGGGAPGANSSAGNDVKSVARTTFDTWAPSRQMAFAKSGGKTHD